MARRIEAETERRASGGLEDTLDLAAIVLLGIGAISALVSLVWMRFWGIVPAFSIFISAALIWLLLRSLAEIIRLLKKQADLPYGGRISGVEQTSLDYKCSDCGAMLHSKTRCDSCGANIETE